MQADKLEAILGELYQLEPSLRDFEIELKKLIIQMSDLRPDTHFTPALATKIKAELFQRLQVNNQDNKKFFYFNIMDKKLVYAATAVMGLAIIAFTLNLVGPLSQRTQESKMVNNLKTNEKRDVANNVQEEGVIKLAANAFGSLRSLAQTMPSHGKMVSASGQEIGVAQAEAGLVMGMGSAPSIEPAVAPVPTLMVNMMSADTVSSSNAGSASATSMVDQKMIAPWFGYTYVYKGDSLSLDQAEATVLRRLKGSSGASANLVSLLGNLDFSGLTLASFENLAATNLSVQENKDRGLSINFDFLEDSVNIYENYQQWRFPERDNCGGDEACWQKFRIKASDYPVDAELVAMADNFLAVQLINLGHYGQAQVENYWRQDYERAPDKENYYIPEYASVVYPLLIDNSLVRDQSGNYFGLRVSINILKKAVSGLNNLTPYRYESSSYELETSVESILKMAAAGGFYRSF
mgnify:FL=1